MARPPAALFAAALGALLAIVGGAALLGSTGAEGFRTQDSPTQVPEPAAPSPEEGKGMAPPPAAAADDSAPVTILYTIHNTGYIEPCG